MRLTERERHALRRILTDHEARSLKRKSLPPGRTVQDFTDEIKLCDELGRKLKDPDVDIGPKTPA